MLVVEIGYTIYSEVACFRRYALIFSFQFKSDLTVSHSNKSIVFPRSQSVVFHLNEFQVFFDIRTTCHTAFP